MSYKHGGNTGEVARRYGIKETSILDFSASITPLGISILAREAIAGSIDLAVKYPDTESLSLLLALSQHHSVPKDNILCGNGSTEFIYLIPRIFRPRKALIIVPAFSEYERALRHTDCGVDYFSLNAEKGFALDMERLFSCLREEYGMLWIGNPGNPGGNLIPKNDMRAIVSKAEENGILCVVDEAFMDFCESESVKEEVNVYDNLIVLRSMTKFYALAGLRVGYLLASERTTKSIREQKEPWTLNSIGEAAAVASLVDGPYRESTLKTVEAERGFLNAELDNIPFLVPCPSSANYILLRLCGGIRSAELWEALLVRHNILVRDCSNYHGLKGEFIRIGVRGREENLKLVDALRDFQDTLPHPDLSFPLER